jgi:hypothetical protein
VRLVVGSTFGVAAYTNATFGRLLGNAWNFDVGAEFFRFASVFVRYQGVWSPAPPPFESSVGAISNGASLITRFAIPIPYVQPYFQGGIGFLHNDTFGIIGNSNAPPLPSNTGQFPVGGGLDIRFTRSFAITGEFMYYFLFNEQFVFTGPTASPWGQLWTASGGLRFYL